MARSCSSRLALIVAEFGRCGGPMGVAERHTCLVLRPARACSEVWPVAADRVGTRPSRAAGDRLGCSHQLALGVAFQPWDSRSV
jgi:hypothetical protein